MRSLLRRRVAGLAWIAVALAAGCGLPAKKPEINLVEKPKDDPNAPAPIPPVDHEAWSKLGYRLDWRSPGFYATKRTQRILHAAAYPDMVLVQDNESTLSYLEPSTGKIRWSSELASPLTRFVGITRDTNDSGRILVSSESELFGVSPATGTLTLREKFDRVVNTSPVTDGPIAVYGCSTGEVLAHMVGMKYRAWGQITPGAIEADPVRVGYAIGVVSQSGDVLFVSGAGAVLGKARMYRGVSTNPVSDGQRMYVASLDQSLWAFAPNGSTVWRVQTPSPLAVQPTATEKAIYCEIPGKGLTAFEPETGLVRWSSKTVRGTVISASPGRLVVWDGTTASIVEPERGDLIASATLAGVEKLVTDRFDGGALYAIGPGPIVGKFVPRK
jgi:outer membrane protein assembly factor BamB